MRGWVYVFEPLFLTGSVEVFFYTAGEDELHVGLLLIIDRTAIELCLGQVRSPQCRSRTTFVK